MKYLFYTFYKWGYFESIRRNSIIDRQTKTMVATFDDTVNLNEARIVNNRSDKQYIIIGANSVIHGELLLFKHGGNITIGSDCFIGHGTKIWSAKNIQIGDRVLISHNVNIHDNNSHSLDAAERHKDFVHIFSKGGLQDNLNIPEQEIIIGNDVWIGFNVIILKGVKIGNGAIVGAGSIVTKDIPDFAVAVGNPIRIIKYST